MLWFLTSLLATHPVSLLEQHFEDLLREEEQVEASKHHRGLGHVAVHHGVEAEGLAHGRESCERGNGSGGVSVQTPREVPTAAVVGTRWRPQIWHCDVWQGRTYQGSATTTCLVVAHEPLQFGIFIHLKYCEYSEYRIYFGQIVFWNKYIIGWKRGFKWRSSNVLQPSTDLANMDIYPV